MTPRLYFLVAGTLFILGLAVYAGFRIVLAVRHLVGA